MASISMRVSEDEMKLIQAYTIANGLSVSSFIRETVLDRIEDDFALDEERILASFRKAKAGKKYDHTEVWEMLGV